MIASMFVRGEVTSSFDYMDKMPSPIRESRYINYRNILQRRPGPQEYSRFENFTVTKRETQIPTSASTLERDEPCFTLSPNIRVQELIEDEDYYSFSNYSIRMPPLTNVPVKINIQSVKRAKPKLVLNGSDIHLGE